MQYYQFYWGTDSKWDRVPDFSIRRTPHLDPGPRGCHTGTYYLRGRSGDVASNWSSWVSLFTFRYDGTPPENPTGITASPAITNDVWQRATNLPAFSWAVAYDEGSGVQG